MSPKNQASKDYQVAVTGQNYETMIRDSTSAVTMKADGLWMPADTAVDAKWIQPGYGSPYVVPDEVRPDIFAYVRMGQHSEFGKYGQIINDPCVPIKNLDVIVSQPRGVSYFESLLAANGLGGAGQVVVVPD
ncbi:hypothetical protein [Nocardioides sp.]|uniref:hypothetical protein n=1 Tax=Nocardioides sp. TaxID=35761 RepID=UPI002B6FFABD|nr:hypothetical protein [Nocardioides sp.]HXH79903.1 hypothetical protein [Nocardioides sp.]